MNSVHDRKIRNVRATVKSTDDLAARINEFADDLVDAYKRNKATEAGDERAAGRTSWRSSASGAPRTSQAMEAELEPIEGSEDDEAERGNPASGGGNLDFVATAYSVARSQINKRTPSPMFPPANHVRSKGKKPINKDRDIVWPEYFDDVCPPLILNE